MNDVLATLDKRGFVGQMTDPGLRDMAMKEMITYYVGFDPTASSLHIGNLKQMEHLSLLRFY